MQKVLGILGLLIVVIGVTAQLNPNYLQPLNIANQIEDASMFGIISIGAALVIIGGGIDLSVGAVVCLTGCLLPWLMVKEGWSAPAALTSVVLLGALLGLLHGLLIVAGRLQPFVVTLCGMLIYRGIARWFTSDSSMGYSGRYKDLSWLVQKLDWTEPYIGIRFPPTAFILIVLGTLALIALNQTIYGRYLLAVGRNEQAARYSGINTGWVTILSYVISGFCAGLGGVLFSLDVQSAQATSLGLAYEFHAIAAAVLGGCSLRGGEGSIIGVVIGATLLQVLRNSLRLIGIPDRAVDCVIGLMILGGVAFDEMVRRISARRRGS